MIEFMKIANYFVADSARLMPISLRSITTCALWAPDEKQSSLLFIPSPYAHVWLGLLLVRASYFIDFQETLN